LHGIKIFVSLHLETKMKNVLNLVSLLQHNNQNKFKCNNLLTYKKKVLIHVKGKEKRITFATRLEKGERSPGAKRETEKREKKFFEDNEATTTT